MLRKLGIEPGEAKVFAWAAAALFLLGWADVSVKNVSETLFIKRVGVELLPLVFLVNSLLLVATTYVVGRIASRADRLRLLPRVLVGAGARADPALVLRPRGPDERVRAARHRVQAAASRSRCWSSGSRSRTCSTVARPKRLFAPLMAGMTLGNDSGELRVGSDQPDDRDRGPAAVVRRCARAERGDGATAPPAARRPARTAARAPVRRLDEDEAAEPGRAGSMTTFRGLWRENRLFRLLFVTAACSGLLGPMLYFQFSYVADLATQGAGGEAKLMAFYSQFRGWISLGVLAAQLAVTSNLYRRIGIPLAAAISPLIYLLGFIGLSVRLSLPAGVGAMAGTKLQDNAVYDPAVRVLFNLFPEDIRPRAMALLEGPVKRAGGALGNVVTLVAVGSGRRRGSASRRCRSPSSGWRSPWCCGGPTRRCCCRRRRAARTSETTSTSPRCSIRTRSAGSPAICSTPIRRVVASPSTWSPRRSPSWLRGSSPRRRSRPPRRRGPC